MHCYEARVLSVADRSADWLEQALRDLEQAEQSMQPPRLEEPPDQLRTSQRNP